ncbi:hypothetical protein DVH05_015500 [Phytophthora capsici]|nr:hypothetical protein DVH05_020723 [Phytophthora capsici]KAG1698016.1 hypothetical protein DVH05_015500 [Phytophthora capsici]
MPLTMRSSSTKIAAYPPVYVPTLATYLMLILAIQTRRRNRLVAKKRSETISRHCYSRLEVTPWHPKTLQNPNVTYLAAPALSSKETIVPQNCHAKMLAAIADDPDLIRFYLGLSQKEPGKRPAPSTEQREFQRRRVLAPSDLLNVFEPSERI